MTTTTLGRRTALAAVYGERYGVSLVFLCLAGLRLHRLLHVSGAERAELEAAPITRIIGEVIWVQLYVFFGLLLLVGRRVQSPPRRIADLLVPLCTTFFYLAYYAIPWLPEWLKQNLCPAGWRAACVVTGESLTLIGLWLSIWATVYLGRSFGVLVEVKKVVLEGAYRWVRHPMYAGYVWFLAGFALASFSLAGFILVPLHIGLLLYRARLEEARLAESSPEYQAYRQRTGFIFPKFNQR
jgi:isoprenylcysteine carboxyl methyltransferase (ICMT) family protein YpbQ